MKDKKGKLFTTMGTDVWRMVSYIEEPTVALENLTTGSKKLILVSQAEERYVELVPAREILKAKEMEYVPEIPSGK